MANRNLKLKRAATQAVDPEPMSGSPACEPVDAVDPVIDHDEIARLAYSYWEARGFSDGSAEEDWYRAEEELKRRTAPANRLGGRTRRRLCG